MLPIRLTAIVILGSCAFALIACGGGGKKTAPPTSQPAVATTTAVSTTPTGTGTPAATEEPFQGGRDPVEAPGPTAPPVLVLTDVRTGEHTGYDRITFEFADSRPGYRVDYRDAAYTSACGSGELVGVEGAALLQVRFTPANAHDEQGRSTVGFQELTPGLTTLLEAQQTCDFEADVTWALGLSQEVDFRVVELDNPPRVAVDVAHP